MPQNDPDVQNGKDKGRASALIPLLVFVVVYLGAGIILSMQGVEMAFYQLPSPVAAVIGIVIAFFIFKGTIDDNFALFAKGCGQENILTMCFIYLFAGAFSQVAGAMNGVDSMVSLGLSVCPVQFVTAGLFLISAFLAMAAGTSMGTISAVGPIGIAMAARADISLPLILGAIVGGAMFGDNLSIISDTTIAATKTQGVEMRDKFRVNLLIALPAAVVTFLLLMIFARPSSVVELGDLSYDIVTIIPYIVILVMALVGFNVFVTLGTGIVVAGVIGLVKGSFGIIALAGDIYMGFEGMIEIFLLSLMIGGLSYMCSHFGGIQWLMEKVSGLIHSEKSAELGISALSALCDITIANNTIAILVAGEPSKEICEKYHVDPRKSASLMDIWACVFQGMLPYSAQILIACGLTAGLVGPMELMTNVWYVLLLAVFAVISVFVPFSDGYLRKHPWNFETWTAEKR